MSENAVTTSRKYLAHYIDAAFDVTYENTDYQLLGADLVEFYTELNPEIETKQNILGENAIYNSGYSPTSSIDPAYHKFGDALSEKILELAASRRVDGWTSYVEVLYKPGATEDDAPTVEWAYREKILIVPTKYGGDVSGVQSPYDIHYTGSRTKGTFDRKSKKFTAGTTTTTGDNGTTTA